MYNLYAYFILDFRKQKSRFQVLPLFMSLIIYFPILVDQHIDRKLKRTKRRKQLAVCLDCCVYIAFLSYRSFIENFIIIDENFKILNMCSTNLTPKATSHVIVVLPII